MELSNNDPSNGSNHFTFGDAYWNLAIVGGSVIMECLISLHHASLGAEMISMVMPF